MMNNRYGFYQTAVNAQKMGYYPTDKTHCELLAKQFTYEEGPVYCLDPGIGDGEMLITVTGKRSKMDKKDLKLFGIEVNEQRATESKEKEELDYVLCSDFPQDVRCGHAVFSFVAANPAYLDEEEETMSGGKMYGEDTRYEVKCLEALPQYMAKDSVILWIVSLPEFFREQHIRKFMNRFEILKIFRFSESEYKKYHQVAVIGRKKTGGAACKQQDVFAFYQKILKEDHFNACFQDGKLDNITFRSALEQDLPLIPMDCPEEEKVRIPATKAPENFVFTGKEFNVAEEMAFVNSNIDEDQQRYMELLGRHMFVKKYKPMDVGICALPLGKAHACLCATSGVGEGCCGEEGEDFHMQRGTAKVIKSVRYEERDGKTVRVESSSTAISMAVLETDGKYTVLE